MPDTATQVEAINAIAFSAFAAMALMALQIVALGFFNPKSKLTLVAAYALWIGLAGILAWFTFHPAIRAMKFVGSPWMFVVIGSLSAIILFALRRSRKDFYGLIEVSVALATPIFLGREYDASGQLTVVIAFIGAIYVMVRGFTNIGEHWKADIEKDKARPATEERREAGAS
ncbi:hypothetical protein U0030_01100 [Brevundimonas bullata]|uniref:hypothetical protein n=1 Tax=Brevundimonas bullata TaxID=13160 RepID=UPI000E09F029|nr:hypothetical protein [Brevundimonas bullata]WQE37096.1 hypothetical protein U0030_01100 [Brevundimonas bullata]